MGTITERPDRSGGDVIRGSVVVYGKCYILGSDFREPRPEITTASVTSFVVEAVRGAFEVPDFAINRDVVLDSVGVLLVSPDGAIALLKVGDC